MSITIPLLLQIEVGPGMSTNYDHFLRGGGQFTGIPSLFFDFLQKKSFKNSEICFAVLLWQYCYRNTLIRPWSLSHTEMARITSCSRRHVMGCLSKLKDAGAISVIPGGVGFESTYLWNVEMFKTGVEFCVLRTYLGKTCTPPVQDLHTPYAQLAHLPRQAVHSSYLELLLKLNIEFFIADAAKSDEENSPATQGDKKAALDSASVSDEMVAAWIAAGRKMASIHGFNVVALVISHHRPLDFGSSDPEGLLASILTSFQAMADLLTVHADELYSNDTEWMAAMYHRYGEISKYNLEKGVQ